jgi:hypothetical protein
MNKKKGKLALDYVAIALLAVLALIILLIFGGKMRDKAIDGLKSFISILGRK